MLVLDPWHLQRSHVLRNLGSLRLRLLLVKMLLVILPRQFFRRELGCLVQHRRHRRLANAALLYKRAVHGNRAA